MQGHFKYLNRHRNNAEPHKHNDRKVLFPGLFISMKIVIFAKNTTYYFFYFFNFQKIPGNYCFPDNCMGLKAINGPNQAVI